MSSAVKKIDLSETQQGFSALVKEVSSIVSHMSGIQLGERQVPMVENRLKTRMLKIGINSPADYIKYLNENKVAESQALLSLLTTHHTFFFREYSHFEYLQFKVLPGLIAKARERADKKIYIWSAACSRGQEVYSLAMFLKFHLNTMAPDVSFEITGSDVDPESVKFAANGVYHHNELKEVPLNYMGTHWVRGKGDIADFVKAKDSIKGHCHFQTVNLLNIGSSMNGKKFDFVWCRNVFIYFNQDQITQCSKVIMNHIYDHGFFFIGVSETLTGLALDVQNVGPSIYTHKSASTKQTLPALKGMPTVIGKAPVAPTLDIDPNYIIRVLCVDDSQSILTLLKKILNKEAGFDVVATALNGREAAEVLKTQKIDLITLDIHMPEVDGITFLKSHYGPKDPPVVMISSVSRDNADIAVKALELGAMDYIEKPTLSNLVTRGDEIKAKLKSTFYNKKVAAQVSSFDNSFKKSLTIKDPEMKRRIVITNLSDRKNISQIIKELERMSPPQFFFFEGAGEALESFTKNFASQHLGRKIIFMKESLGKYEPGVCYFADFSLLESVRFNSKGAKTSFMVMGVPTKSIAEGVMKWDQIHLLLEDHGPKAKGRLLGDVCNDFIPVTSYVSISSEFFEGLK